MKELPSNLATIMDSLGHHIAIELIEIFDRQQARAILDLKQMLEEKSFREAAFLAHSLKSSAANIGAIELASLYRAIETAPVENLSSEMLEKISIGYAHYKVYVSEWIKTG